jgi:hypothetical protein
MYIEKMNEKDKTLQTTNLPLIYRFPSNEEGGGGSKGSKES